MRHFIKIKKEFTKEEIFIQFDEAEGTQNEIKLNTNSTQTTPPTPPTRPHTHHTHTTSLCKTCTKS